MGRGNYLPHGSGGSNYEMVYVDWPPYEELQSCGDETGSIWYDRLVGDIRAALPSLDKADEFIDHDARVRLRNTLLEVAFSDNEWSMAVFIQQRTWHGEIEEKYTGLAAHHIQLAHRKLVNSLLDKGYALYVRTSAWTSAPLKERL